MQGVKAQTQHERGLGSFGGTVQQYVPTQHSFIDDQFSTLRTIQFQWSGPVRRGELAPYSITSGRVAGADSALFVLRKEEHANTPRRFQQCAASTATDVSCRDEHNDDTVAHATQARM